MALKRIIIVASMLAAAGVLGISVNAEAAEYTCTPTHVGITGLGGTTVQIRCSNGIWYYGFVTTTSGCSGVGADVAKGWLGLGQSALLSGKHLLLNYTGTTCLQNVHLTN